MKNLTRANVEAKDELFATLDTNIKTIDPRTRPRILLSDTVGFIRNLPHALVESFKSTLDEVLEANLLLHVVDVSHPRYRDHMAITKQVLDEIGAGEIPQIMIFNKVDRLEDAVLPRILRAAHPNSKVLAAISDQDVRDLREHIYWFFRKNFVNYDLLIPTNQQTALSMVYKNCLILHTDYDASGRVHFKVQSTREVFEKLKKFICSEEEISLLVEKNDAE
jgi:GTP-binding protein HflX